MERDLEFREPVCFDMKFNSDVEDSGYSSDDVELDDSENERATALDDGFDVVENEEILVEKLLIGNMKKSGSSPCTRSKAPMVEPEKKKNLSKGKGKAAMVEPVEEYFSEELDSSDPDESEEYFSEEYFCNVF